MNYERQNLRAFAEEWQQSSEARKRRRNQAGSRTALLADSWILVCGELMGVVMVPKPEPAPASGNCNF